MHTLEFALASNDVNTCRTLAKTLNGHLYVDERQPQKLPFHALLTCVTDDWEALAPVADVGLYVVCRRVIKPGTPNKVALFPMVHNPSRTPAECDAHWRDIHAPLALVHHQAMTHYAQLKVVHTFQGLAVGGFALCGFANETDLRERFYTHADSVKIITEDVHKFAHPEASPRRLVATYEHY